MSYRYRFAKANTQKVNKMRNYTVNQLKSFFANKNNIYDEEEDYFSFENMFEQDEIFDFGNNYFIPGCVMSVSEPLFKKTDTNDYFESYMPYICTEQAFLAVIEAYRNYITDYYKKMLDNEDELKESCNEKIKTWDKFSTIMNYSVNEENQDRMGRLNIAHYPYNLNLKQERIVNSCLFEYEIFELVRLYKTFDWENNVLLFYGW